MNKLQSATNLLLIFLLLLLSTPVIAGDPPVDEESEEERSHKLNHVKTITGRISPKSIVHNGKGVFFAQNMMYKHTVTVYNRKYNLLKTIKDEVKLADYGYEKYKGTYKGSPVECAFSHDGKYAWVSNYEMKGGTSREFIKPGCDGCVGNRYDKSYVYKINTENFELEEVVEVGSVPKYIAVTPDDKYVLVSNWTSSDLSVISTETDKEIRRINLGRLPRGIVVDSKSTYAYVAIMGSNKVAKVNLYNYKVSWIKDVGRGPRHLCISPDDDYLYATLNNEGKVIKIDLDTYEKTEVRTGSNPRSMVMSEDGEFLYVVNYSSNRLSKIETSTMEVVHESRTNSKPIGITFDEKTKNIWVACYTGRIMVFHDTYYDKDEKFMLANKEQDNLLKFLSYSYIVKKPKVEKEVPKQILSLREIAEITGRDGEDRTLARADVKATAKVKEKVRPMTTRSVSTREKPEVKTRSTRINTLERRTLITANKPRVKPSSSTKSFLVITGSFRDKTNAKRRLNLMKKRGYDAGIYFSPKKNLNMVYIKRCSSREEAQKFANSKRLEAWIFQTK